MKKFIRNNTKIVHIIFIALVGLFEVFLLTRNSRVLGFGGDWFLQSVSFYEYFRNLFYETKDIFPDLAPHISGGINIYYLAYYGLFSPYLLLFYCLQFIKAGDFLMITGFLNIVISAILLYIFLLKNNYSNEKSLFGSLLLLVSTGIIYFNFTFVMFVQYIPFFILGLIGTKEFIDNNKNTLLIISVVLIITTSYFFSIPAILSLCLYALYYYLKVNNNVKPKIIFKDVIRYVSRIILSIIISSFLLLPVIYAVLIGRTSQPIELEMSQFLFGIDINHLMYDSNGLGLSSIVWISIIYNILFMKRENKVLTITLLIILGMPIFNLILNGFLYINGKVIIPFIPLIIILILEMLNEIKNVSNNKMILVFICSIISSVIMIKFGDLLHICVFYLDLAITFIILMLYRKKENTLYIYLLVLFIVLFSIYFVDRKGQLLSKSEYNELYKNISINMNEYINTTSIYRTEFDIGNISVNYSDASSIYRTTIYSSTYNKLYKDIFYNTFNNNFRSANMLNVSSQENLFFEKFMGVRYLFTKYDAPYGYEKLADFDTITLYENDNVYPIGFASSNLINKEEYKQLSFIEKLIAYQNNIIVDSDSKNSDLKIEYQELNLNSFAVNDKKSMIISENNGHYLINNSSYNNLVLKLKQTLKNKTLVIRFNVESKMECNNDTRISIDINDVKNQTTCSELSYYNDNKTFDYVISSNEAIEELNINLSKGIYEISNIEIYSIDNTFFDKNNITPLNIDFDKSKGDIIEGNINVKEDGYFLFTIPYDYGYNVYVDGNLVEIERASDGFIGFKIKKGNHTIKLTFEAPFAKLGKIISLVGIIGLIIINRYERKHKILV